MKVVWWALLLCLPRAWSFHVTVIPRLRHLIASSRSRCCSVDCQRAGAAANNAVVHSPIRQDLSMMSAGASERSPIHILRGAVASTIAAVLLLANEGSPVLAEEFPGVSMVPLSETTAVQKPATDSLVVPTTKLEGELKSQFQKAQNAGSVQQFDKALKLYNQVIKYAPGYVYGWSNRANVLIASQDLNGALSDYNKALELAEGLTLPDKWVIFLNRGTTLLAMGENDRALADFDEAAQLCKRKDVFILANRAQALERKGEWSEALSDYEGAVNLQPGNIQPWWIRYGLVLFQEGREFDSLSCLQRLQTKFEGVGEIQAALTAVHFGRGQTREAEKMWAGINRVDQQKFLEDTYLKNQLRWPPRAIKALRSFDRDVVAQDLNKNTR